MSTHGCKHMSTAPYTWLHTRLSTCLHACLHTCLAAVDVEAGTRFLPLGRRMLGLTSPAPSPTTRRHRRPPTILSPRCHCTAVAARSRRRRAVAWLGWMGGRGRHRTRSACRSVRAHAHVRAGLCVRVCVVAHVCASVMRTPACTGVHMRVCACSHVRVYTRVRANHSKCVGAHECVCMYAFMHSCMHAHAHARACTCMCIYARLHDCMSVQTQFDFGSLFFINRTLTAAVEQLHHDSDDWRSQESF